MQKPDELFEVMAQCLLNAVDRDSLSGWGGVIHIMFVPLALFPAISANLLFSRSEKDKITTRTVKGRMD